MAKETPPPALQGLSKLFKNGQAKRGTPTLPDGTYQGEIVAAIQAKTKKKKLQVDWTLKVLAGEYEGRTQHKYDLLVTQENVDWFLGVLEVLEVEAPSDASEMKSTLKSCVGKKVEFSVKSSGDFSNVYINELLENSEDEGEGNDEPTFEEGDEVQVKHKGKTKTGTIQSVDEDAKTASVEIEGVDDAIDFDFSDMKKSE